MGCLVTEALLQLGANVDERHPTNGATSLIMQAWSPILKEASGLQLLLRYGADVNAKDKHGDTFLHALVWRQNLDVLRRLYAENQNEMTAIDYSINNNNGETAVNFAQKLHQEATDGKAKQRADEIAALLQLQHDFQSRRLPPFILSALDPHLIPDLAAIVVSYMYAHPHPTPSSSSPSS